jgi:hypothetical protein
MSQERERTGKKDISIKRKWAIAPRGKYEAGRKALNDMTMHEAKRHMMQPVLI